MAGIKLAVFSAKAYDKKFLSQAYDARDNGPADPSSHPDGQISKDQTGLADKPSPPAVEVVFHDFPLSNDTVQLAQGATAVCVFVNDVLTKEVLEALYSDGVRAVLLRCAGFNNVDLDTAERLGLFVANVPSYSPQAVAEFSVALLQTLNRQTHRAYNRVREGNFNLDGLLGKTLYGKTVGIIGTGRIGLAAAQIFKGYNCRILAFDPFPSKDFKEFGEYADLDTMLPQCDFVTLHCPLSDRTWHIINEASLAKMKAGALLVNTSRGGLIDTHATIEALKSRHLGGLALDVYESEGSLFYNDHSGEIIQDDKLMRLMTFPNVLICGHQAFFTEEALTEIGNTTVQNFDAFLRGVECKFSLTKARASHPVRI